MCIGRSGSTKPCRSGVLGSCRYVGIGGRQSMFISQTGSLSTPQYSSGRRCSGRFAGGGGLTLNPPVSGSTKPDAATTTSGLRPPILTPRVRAVLSIVGLPSSSAFMALSTLILEDPTPSAYLTLYRQGPD